MSEENKNSKTKYIIGICIGIVLLSVLVYGLVSLYNQKPEPIVANNLTNITTNQQPVQTIQILTGCKYDNPKCEGGYRCVNNQCTKIVSGGHSGGGSDSGIVVIPGGGGIS